MPERWLGIVVSGDRVTSVDAEVPDHGPLILQADQSWSLQAGNRASAYGVMHQRVCDYIREHGITRTVIKASAVSQGGMRKANLDAAELRGVVMCAAAVASETQCLAKSHISRTFGERNVDDYVADEPFWDSNVAGALRTGSREAAMLLLASRAEQ
jgi:hypothetical protein